MPLLELTFAITNTEKIPTDHGYMLYGGICKLISRLHEKNGVAIHGFSGIPTRKRELILTKNSKLRIRLEHELLPEFLKLAGKTLTIAGRKITLAVPQTSLLRPRGNLYSRLIIIKGALEEDQFLVSLKRQLEALNVYKQPVFFKDPAKLDQKSIRKTMNIKGKELVGYPVMFTGLSDTESLILQEKGLGGKRKMGCGCFVGVRV